MADYSFCYDSLRHRTYEVAIGRLYSPYTGAVILARVMTNAGFCTGYS